VAPTWDHELPSLVLNEVSVHAGSLTEAWKAPSTAYLVRSVLVVTGEIPESMPFEYASAQCVVRDFFDALATRYGMVWTQDERTGVTWLHPADLPYDRVLTARLHVAQPHLGLPMQSGILDTLGASGLTGITVKQWGSLFLNTFDYAVDIPAGTYTIRDLLNLCCVANPTKTFLARTNPDGMFVTAVNLVSDEARSVPPGALYWWDVEIGAERGQPVPTADQLIAALADDKAAVRRAARTYLEAIIWNVPVDDLAAHSVSGAQALWVCIGLLSVLVRSETATHRTSIEIMQRLATGNFFIECESELAVMTALELARLAKDLRALEVVVRRNLVAEDIREVASDACRVAASSPFVREALRSKTAEALLKSLTALAALIRSTAPGKLDFKFGS
jgi:hypothetical protein